MASVSILWVWVTNFYMRQAYGLLDAWGFEERTLLTWVKTDKAVLKERFGRGHWLRCATEQCIMAVRGKPVHLLGNENTVFFAPLLGDSEKPDEFYALVAQPVPHRMAAKVDRFARK